MKKLIAAFTVAVALVAGPLLAAPAANAAPMSTDVVYTGVPKNLHVEVLKISNGYLVAWDKLAHAPKDLRYTVTFQHVASGVGWFSKVAAGKNYFVFHPTDVGTSVPIVGKWLVSVAGATATHPFYALGARHFKVQPSCKQITVTKDWSCGIYGVL